MASDELEARRTEIHRLRAEGLPVDEIVQQLGCSRMTVYRDLARRPGPDGRRVAKETPRKILDRLVVAQRRVADSYRGLTPSDREAAAAADPDSMDDEVRLLRAFIHSLTAQVGATPGSDPARFALIRLIRELTDSVARAFRATRAAPTSQRDEILDEVAEERRIQETSDGAHDPTDPSVGGRA